MKKIIAIAALIASAQASAFWGWNDATGYQQARTDASGQGAAEAEADFSFDMSFTARFNGQGRGTGTGHAAGHGYGESAHIPYYAAPYGYLPASVAPVN